MFVLQKSVDKIEMDTQKLFQGSLNAWICDMYIIRYSAVSKI